MKQFLILVLCIFSFELIGQRLPILVKNDANLFYTGISNLVTIKLNGADPSDVSIKISEGYLSKTSDTSYVVRYDMLFEEVKVKLYFKKLPIDVWVLKVAQLPKPTILIAGESAKIPMSKIEHASVISFDFGPAVSQGLIKDFYNFRIQVWDPQGQVLLTQQIHQAKFPNFVSDRLSKLLPGSKIVVDSVSFLSFQNSIVSIPNDPYEFIVVP